jgi:hypothetical protein
MIFLEVTLVVMSACWRAASCGLEKLRRRVWGRHQGPDAIAAQRAHAGGEGRCGSSGAKTEAERSTRPTDVSSIPVCFSSRLKVNMVAPIPPQPKDATTVDDNVADGKIYITNLAHMGAYGAFR